jgi:hypothetical protein
VQAGGEIGGGMPQFIKMGLGGTGYMGKKESFLRSERMRAARRKVLPGYPVNAPFQSILEVREYLAGDRVTCLLCGKNYKDISKHIVKIHNITPDEYRKKYNIPWTYGIVCRETSLAYKDCMIKRMDEGYIPPMKIDAEQAAMAGVKKRICPFKTEVGILNLSPHPIHPLMPDPDGKMETFTARRERLTAKKGTKEFHEKMKNRPQVMATVNILKTYWIGRKQSEEHKRKRFANVTPKETP